MALKIEQDGVEYSYLGRRKPRRGDYLLSDHVGLFKCMVDDPNDQPIFRPKPKRHVFGGVVFEETGEVRNPTANEWWTFQDRKSVICFGAVLTPQIILRPTAIRETDGSD